MEEVHEKTHRNSWPLKGSEVAVALWVFVAVNTCITIFAVYPKATAYKIKWLIVGLVFVNTMLSIRLFGTLYLRKKSAERHQLVRRIRDTALFADFRKKIFMLLLTSFESWGILFKIRDDMVYAVGIAMGIAMAYDALFRKEK